MPLTKTCNVYIIIVATPIAKKKTLQKKKVKHTRMEAMNEIRRSGIIRGEENLSDFNKSWSDDNTCNTFIN